MNKIYYPHISALILGLASMPLIYLGIDLIFATLTIPGVLALYGTPVINVLFIGLLIFLPMIKQVEESVKKHMRLALITLLVGYVTGYFALTITQSIIN